MPLTLSTPKTGGSKPLLRWLFSGKLIDGSAGELTPMKLRRASVAMPTLSSVSVVRVAAVSSQAGTQPG